MIALFVSAAAVGVRLLIVMQKGSLSAHGARRMFPPTNFPLRPRSFGGNLMTAISAEILLITFRIFVDAFCGETIIPKGMRGSQLSFKFTIRYFKYGVRTNEKLNSFSSIRYSFFNSGPHEFEPTPLWA